MRRLALIPRENWQARAEAGGFAFHSEGARPYWDESGAYAFSRAQIAQVLVPAAIAVEDMALAFVDEAVRAPAILARLGLPETFFTPVEKSWAKGERNLYSRLDFRYDGHSAPQLLAYTADTPSGLLEAGVFQALWLQDRMECGLLPDGVDQFNALDGALVAALRGIRGGAPYRLHLAAARAHPYDVAVRDYLAEQAQAAGCAVDLLDLADIGLTPEGGFVDLAEAPIDVLLKLYPWEWVLRADFAEAIPGCHTQFIEPLWKAVLASRGLMPELWRRARGHANLVPAAYDHETLPEIGGSYIEKPLFAREGEYFRLIERGQVIGDDAPPFASGFIRQQKLTAADFGHGAVICSIFMVASSPVALLMQEDKSAAGGQLNRLLPHFIEG